MDVMGGVLGRSRQAGHMLAALFAFLAPVSAQPSEIVTFATSCSASVADDFNHALTLLHSFEYPETTRLFRDISEKDPGCAMARWGSAMSIWHPLWQPPSVAGLEEGARLLRETRGMSVTRRESEYVDALQSFFANSDPSQHADRARAYSDKMARVYARNLDDPEAAVFYALSLLATAEPHDKSYARQFKSAGLLNWVRDSQPEHPGVLHYLIHSYDFPGMAHLGLTAATIYADAAPDSAHAQHMPSHIFTRLGIWDRSLASNHDSTRSAADFTARAHLPGHYDEGLHSIDYLMYAMLQTARDDEALQLLQRLAAITRTDTENFKVAYAYAASPARYALERRKWREASELQVIRRDFPWDEFGWAQSIRFFARGIGAARLGNAAQARIELQAIRELQLALPPTTAPYWREEAQVQIDAVTSWALMAEGRVEEALLLASAAADREDAVDKHPVTPGEVLPARELYADMLSAAGRFGPALQQYEGVLESSPNRLNALIGAADAAAGLGDGAGAERYQAIARRQTMHGQGPRANYRASSTP